MKILKKTTIFISYSRRDETFAEYLYTALSNKGYDVFFDREGILIGEDFADKIQHSIRRTDAFIFIISKDSINSKWCKAEVYTSIAMNKRFVPIKYKGDEFNHLEDFVLFPKNINYVVVKEKSDYQFAIDKIHHLLASTRRENLFKGLRLSGVILAVVALGFFAFIQLTKNINRWDLNRKKGDLISQIKSASETYTSKQIETMVSDFNGDVEFREKMRQLSFDRANNDQIRLNAYLITTFLEQHDKANKRWYINGLTISENQFMNGNFSNTTFMDSTEMDNMYFVNTNFNNVLWALRISSSKYKSCRFYSNRILPAVMIDVDFENCIFKGSELDVPNLGAVHFYFKPEDSTSTVITDDFALFNNCTINNCIDPPAPHVVEILNDDSEVRFTGVIFESCQFRGFIRGRWFKKCTFINCVFPKGFDTEMLETNDCIVQNILFADIPCY